MILHPATWAALRREKDSMGCSILDLQAGPANLTYDGSPAARVTATPTGYGIEPQGAGTGYGSLWGVPVVESTQCPAGTGVVLSVKAGAAVGWTRMGMIVEYDPWGDTEWTTNTYSWRCEERISLTTPRPSAINIVTGLPTA